MHSPVTIRQNNLFTTIHILVFALLLCAAAFIRLWAAPLSAGPDVSQFWAFAEVFRQHGLDFYRFADARLDIFPFKAWSYVYPPVWLLFLALALLAAPDSLATNQMADPAWRLAMKTPIIIADLAVGILLYWSLPSSRPVKLLFAVLWLFNPMVWYNSAVFGQFDAIPAAFLVASIILIEKGYDRVGFAVLALAIMTKQHTLLPVVIMILSLARSLPRRRLLEDCGIALALIVVISIPFVVTGNILAYLKAFFLPGQGAFYQYPLVYAFGGVGALVTYIHDTLGWETARYLNTGIVLLGLSLIVCCFFTWTRRIGLLRGALVGYLLFIAFFYRINYQYLVIIVPMALLITSRSPYLGEKIMTLVLALYPALWLWLFNTSFWFYYLVPQNTWVTPVFERLGLVRGGIPDLVYVIFALILMCLCIAYVVGVYTRWREPLKPLENVVQGGMG